MPALKYKSEFHCADFVKLSAEGLCKVEICAEWEIHKDTMYEWIKKYPEFKAATKVGLQLLEAAYIKKGKQMAYGDLKGGNVAAWIWLTKNVLGYSDKVETSNKVSIDGIAFSEDEDE